MKRWFKIVVGIFFIIAVAMFAYGSSLSDTCVTIGGQKTCWKNYDVTINSPLCTKNPCTATSGLQKYNAVVDAISSACDKAKQNDFSDSNRNNDIQNALQQITAYNVDAKTLCSDPGVILAKKFYD